MSKGHQVYPEVGNKEEVSKGVWPPIIVKAASLLILEWYLSSNVKTVIFLSSDVKTEGEEKKKSDL